MRRISVVIVALWLSAVALVAQSSGQAMSYESITVANTAVGFTATTLRPNPSGLPQAMQCGGRLETAQIRYRYDGSAPTSSEGELLEVGDRITISGNENLRKFLAIRTGGTSGVLKMTCTQ
jgi:hypothetical protein